MSLWPDQRCTVMRAAMVLVLLGTVVVPVWAEEKQDVLGESERTARIQNSSGNGREWKASCVNSARSRKGRRGPLFRGLNSRISRREA